MGPQEFCICFSLDHGSCSYLELSAGSSGFMPVSWYVECACYIDCECEERPLPVLDVWIWTAAVTLFAL